MPGAIMPSARMSRTHLLGERLLRPSSLSACLLLLAVLWLLPPCATPASAVVGSDADLETTIRAHIPSGLGTYAVAVKDLTSGRSAYVSGDEVLETGSLFTVLIMVDCSRQARLD